MLITYRNLLERVKAVTFVLNGFFFNSSFYNLFILINLFYFWFYWVFITVCGLRIAVASLLVELGLWSAGSVVVAYRLSCSLACGIFLDQGLNPCLLNWQADSSYPLYHQGSPKPITFM